MRTTPAQRYVMRMQAAKMAVVAAHLEANGGGPANDNAAGEAATGYERMLGQLAEDMRRLKLIQSVERKVDLKRELVDHYAPWIAGALAEAKLTGAAAQDEVLGTIMTWRMDVGDYVGALTIAEHILRYRLQMPDRFQRKPAVWLAEEVAEAAIKAFAVEKPFSADILELTEILVDGEDMPDQVRAKLHKALGLSSILHAVTEQPEGQASAGWPKTAWAAAKEHLLRAVELHEKVGVKKDIEKVDRALKALGEESGGKPA